MALRITLGDLLHECAEKFAKRQFLVIAETGETLTYHEFEILFFFLNPIIRAYYYPIYPNRCTQ